MLNRLCPYLCVSVFPYRHPQLKVFWMNKAVLVLIRVWLKTIWKFFQLFLENFKLGLC